MFNNMINSIFSSSSASSVSGYTLYAPGGINMEIKVDLHSPSSIEKGIEFLSGFWADDSSYRRKNITRLNKAMENLTTVGGTKVAGLDKEISRLENLKEEYATRGMDHLIDGIEKKITDHNNKKAKALGEQQVETNESTMPHTAEFIKSLIPKDTGTAKNAAARPMERFSAIRLAKAHGQGVVDTGSEILVVQAGDPIAKGKLIKLANLSPEGQDTIAMMEVIAEYKY